MLPLLGCTCFLVRLPHSLVPDWSSVLGVSLVRVGKMILDSRASCLDDASRAAARRCTATSSCHLNTRRTLHAGPGPTKTITWVRINQSDRICGLPIGSRCETLDSQIVAQFACPAQYTIYGIQRHCTAGLVKAAEGSFPDHNMMLSEPPLDLPQGRPVVQLRRVGLHSAESCKGSTFRRKNGRHKVSQFRQTK